MEEWNAEHDTQCVDVNHTSANTARVTVRSNAQDMSDRGLRGVEMALRVAPDDGLKVDSVLYSQFASNGYTYMTFVIFWA